MNKAAFVKAETRLLNKKEDLFKHPNPNKWDITPEDLAKADKKELLKNKDYAFKFMMGKETNHVEKLKQFYVYYSNQLFSEFNRLRNMNGNRHKERVVKLSQNHSDIMSDVIKFFLFIFSYF